MPNKNDPEAKPRARWPNAPTRITASFELRKEISLQLDRVCENLASAQAYVAPYVTLDKKGLAAKLAADIKKADMKDIVGKLEDVDPETLKAAMEELEARKKKAAK